MVNPEREVPTLPHQKVMTSEFIEAYRKALTFSNLALDHELKYRNVHIFDKEHIHELFTVSPKHLPHLVLLHGFGGSSLTFVRTFEHFKDHFQVHALDTYGIGLSSRGNWSKDMGYQETADYYIGAIEEWRKSVGIESFILAGHSFGGYISALYYEKYRERVKQLIFLSPAGSGKIPAETIQERANRAKMFFCVAEKIYNCNIRPSKLMNAFFIGKKVINRLLTNRLKLPEEEKDAWTTYLNHVVDQDENSEGGFYKFFDWPVQPVRSIEDIIRTQEKQKKASLRIDFLFGDEDWMVKEGAQNLVQDYDNIHFHVIDRAGHQLIFDNPRGVTEQVRRVIEGKE